MNKKEEFVNFSDITKNEINEKPLSKNAEFIERIKTRKAKLEEVRKKLKQKFIGIDDIIDQIINNINVWYLMPELQTRPLIVSLWGTTGVGKTDLVRSLVNYLEFNDKFVEIQMDMKDVYIKNIQTILDQTNIESKEPSILLLDEMQRFRTIDEVSGALLSNDYFNDIWMLLSDGKFQSDSKNKNTIFTMLIEEMYDSQWEKENIEFNKEQEANKNEAVLESSGTPTKGIINPSSDKVAKSNTQFKRMYKTYYWTANKLKKLLKLDQSIEEIMKMSSEERLLLLREHLNNNKIYEGDTYQKMLIFISGNLDEAFQMSEDVEDVEQDADIYHEFSKKINIIDIKKSLTRKFKPEQIARFGNIHIIYPCLSRDSYEKIIKKRCQETIDNVYNLHKVKINLSESVYRIIYNNGVYPTQGVRPVISTIAQFLDNNLPYFLYNAIENDVNYINVEYDNNQLYCIINKTKYTRDLLLTIDNIRRNKSADEKTLVLVHELGHALNYAILNNITPTQININSTNYNGEGFVSNHTTVIDKEKALKRICIGMSGQVAEEIVFGENHKCNGSAGDIFNATQLAASYIRQWGFDGYTSRLHNQYAKESADLNYDLDDTNKLIEQLVSEQKKKAKDLIMSNLSIFKKLISFGKENGKIEIDDFVRICNENGLNISKMEIQDKIIHNYFKKVEEFLNQ